MGFRLLRLTTAAVATAAVVALGFSATVTQAQETSGIPAAQAPKFGPSGLPLPRFASLKSSNINLRVGPGTDYPILWNYVRSGLPVEIVLEFDTWRKIRDADGVEGWVYQSMLSGKRTATVAPWAARTPDGIAAIIEASASEPDKTVALYGRPDAGSRQVALIEPGVNVRLVSCEAKWCAVDAGSYSGWMQKDALWGVYPDETLDN